MGKELKDIKCDKCGRFLIGAPRGSLTWCPWCSRWVRQDKNKKEVVN